MPFVQAPIAVVLAFALGREQLLTTCEGQVTGGTMHVLLEGVLQLPLTQV